MTNPVFAMLGEKSGKIKKVEKHIEVVSGYTVLPVEIEEFHITDNKELNKFLIEKTIEIQSLQAQTSISLGKIFEEVHEKLAGDNHHNGTYVEWLERNGFNKVTALRHRRRHHMYNLVTSEKGKSFVATLPVRVIDSLYRYEDFSGIIAVIDDGITRNELESMIASPVGFEGVDILPYNPKQSEKVYKEVSKFFRNVQLEKVSDENADAFEKDMLRIEKILSKWQGE